MCALARDDVPLACARCCDADILGGIGPSSTFVDDTGTPITGVNNRNIEAGLGVIYDVDEGLGVYDDDFTAYPHRASLDVYYQKTTTWIVTPRVRGCGCDRNTPSSGLSIYLSNKLLGLG